MADYSQFIVTGPVYTWVGLGASSAFLFLGFTETGLTVAINPYNEDIQVDFAGPSLPGDVSQFGFDVNISGTFTHFSEITAQKVISMAGNFSGAQNPGSMANNQMGALMNLEGVGYPILCYFPYSTKNAFSNEIPGYNFNLGYLNNPYQFTASVRRKAPEFSFRCVPVFGTFSGSTFSPNTAPWNASQVYTNIMPNPLPSID